MQQFLVNKEGASCTLIYYNMYTQCMPTTLFSPQPTKQTIHTCQCLRHFSITPNHSNRPTAHALHISPLPFYHTLLASYPGHVGGGKSGLVSTVCACANDSGNFSRTSPIMDKLHVVVMRRNNQTRYTACGVAAVLTRRWLP